MSQSKDKIRNTWSVYIRYIDWQGKKQIHTKRGFRTKKEAQEYEREFLLLKSRDVNMSFRTFTDLYLEDLKPRLKYNTFLTKAHIIRTKILPYFGERNLAEIDTTDILQWQNVLLKCEDEEGKRYSPVYLRTIQAQLSAIFNHAVKYYALKENPVVKAGCLGKSKGSEMLFWTKEEYVQFAKTMKEKPISFYAFELLYWCGIREGELLALTRKDFDLKKRTLRINKSFQRLKGQDYITAPKTEKSNRVIDLPDFLISEMEDFFGSIYGLQEDMQLFPFSKSYLHHEMDRGVKASGVKRIRIHDLRHSHVAYLINLGYSPLAIAERVGHEGISVTFNYAHLYPSKQREMADSIDEDRKKEEKRYGRDEDLSQGESGQEHDSEEEG